MYIPTLSGWKHGHLAVRVDRCAGVLRLCCGKCNRHFHKIAKVYAPLGSLLAATVVMLCASRLHVAPTWWSFWQIAHQRPADGCSTAAKAAGAADAGRLLYRNDVCIIMKRVVTGGCGATLRMWHKQFLPRDQAAGSVHTTAS